MVTFPNKIKFHQNLGQILDYKEKENATLVPAFGWIKAYDPMTGVVRVNIKKEDGKDVDETIEYSLDNNYTLDQIEDRLKIKTSLSTLRSKFGQGDDVVRIMNDIVQLGLRHQPKQSQFIYNRDTKNLFSIMSSRFVYIPDIDIIKKAIATYGEDVQGQFSYTNGLWTVLSFVFPDTLDKRLAELGEPIQGGVQISNSAFGYRSLTLRNFYFRLSCKNGNTNQVFADIDKFIHANRSATDIMKDYENALLNKKTAIDTSFATVVTNAMKRENVFQTTDGLAEFLKKYGIRGKVLESTVAKLTTGQHEMSLSSWDVYNAVTYEATHHPDLAPDVRETLLQLATPILRM